MGSSRTRYLNDRLSLDGHDPSTWGNIADMFGGGMPQSERTIHGRVATRSDGSTQRRDGGPEWLATAPTPAVLRPDVPDRLPTIPYLTG